MTKREPGTFVFEEISSQGSAWDELIDQLLEKTSMIQQVFEGSQYILFSGCGSAFNVAITAAPLFQNETGKLARAVPAADIFLFPSNYLQPGLKTVAVLISRSGQTTETLQAMETLKRYGIKTVGITCTSGSPLDTDTDLGIVLSPVVEQAVTTTRSVTGMVLSIQVIGAVLSDNQEALAEIKKLPEDFEQSVRMFHEVGKAVGERRDIEKYAFLGNAPFFGISKEAQLKMKEMTLLPSDSYPALDFRHGPKALVDEKMLVVVLVSDSGKEDEIKVMKDMKKQNGIIWTICESTDAEISLYSDYVVELKSSLGEYSRIILYLPAIQYMAYYRALGLGLDPDEPLNLTYWVDTSE